MKEYLVKNYRNIFINNIVFNDSSFVIPIFSTPNKIKNLLSNIKFNPNSLTKLFTINIRFKSIPNLKPLGLNITKNAFNLTPISPDNTSTGRTNESIALDAQQHYTQQTNYISNKNPYKNTDQSTHPTKNQNRPALQMFFQ